MGILSSIQTADPGVRENKNLILQVSKWVCILMNNGMHMIIHRNLRRIIDFDTERPRTQGVGKQKKEIKVAILRPIVYHVNVN
jgi:hypothetical protein